MGGYPQALALTLVIEVPIYAAALGPMARASGGPTLSWPRTLYLGVVANLVSHPIAFLVILPLLVQLTGRTVALVLVEVGVLVLEAAIIGCWLRNGTLALVTSSLANIASLTAGALLAG